MADSNNLIDFLEERAKRLARRPGDAGTLPHTSATAGDMVMELLGMAAPVAARAAGCSEDEAVFDRNLKRIAKQPRTVMPKKTRAKPKG